jgi:hypothetical protein
MVRLSLSITPVYDSVWRMESLLSLGGVMLGVVCLILFVLMIRLVLLEEFMTGEDEVQEGE